MSIKMVSSSTTRLGILVFLLALMQAIIKPAPALNAFFWWLVIVI